MVMEVPVKDGDSVVYAMVDDSVYDLVSIGKWSLYYKGYQQAWINGKHMTLHRYVCELNGIVIPSKMTVHHRNDNKLDNRISNLEIVSNAYNCFLKFNRPLEEWGVHYDKNRRMYKVQFNWKSKDKYFGSFSKKEDAIQCALEIRRTYGIS